MKKALIGCLLGVMLSTAAHAIREAQTNDGATVYVWSAEEMQKMDDVIRAYIQERDAMRRELKKYREQCV